MKKTLRSGFFFELKENLAAIRKVNAVVRSIDPFIARWGWIASALQGLSTLAKFTVAGILLQTMLSRFTEAKNLSWTSLITICVAFAAYVLIKGILGRYFHLRAEIFGERIAFELNKRFIEKSAKLDIGTVTSPGFFQTKTMASHGKWAASQIFSGRNSMVSGLFGVAASIVAVLYIDKMLFLVAALMVIPQAIKAVLYTKKFTEQRTANDNEDRKNHEYFWYLSNAYGLAEAKLFKYVRYMFGKYVGSQERILGGKIALDRSSARADIFVIFCKAILLLLALLYLGKGCIDGKFTFGAVLIFAGSLQALAESLGSLSENYTSLGRHVKDYAAFEKYFDIQPLVSDAGTQSVLFDHTPKISLKNLSFAYPSKPSASIVNSISLDIYPGEKIVIIGNNGAGKSTLLKLIAKFYNLTEGDILFGSTSITGISQESLLDNIVYVTQDTIFPELPIKEALTGSDSPDMECLTYAASLSGADTVIAQKCLHGYDTRIGSSWEDGQGFSSGELQRLKLAGALYRMFKHNIQIGIFDEPVTNCDSETKLRFYSLMEEFHDRTIIVIAHDHAYLHHFERVIEIQDGSVAREYRDPDSIEELSDRLLGKKKKQKVLEWAH